MISPESEAAAVPQGPDLKCGTSVPGNGFAALRSGEGRNLGLCLKSYQLWLLNLIFKVLKALVSSWGIQAFCLLGFFQDMNV